MPKPLTVEVFLGALAFAAVGAACSKSATEARPEPASAPPRAAAPASVAAPAIVVDAGVEGTPPSTRKGGPAASCGASGCSPDMKKNK